MKTTSMLGKLAVATCSFAFAAILSANSAIAAQIFFDDFSGGTSDLNGTTPDVRPASETWVASSVFDANGAISGTGAGSATLAFTPQNGFVYTLDASFTGITGDGNWLALGFADGQSSSVSTNNRFLTADTIGRAWLFARGDNSANPNVAWLGNGGSGTADSADWTGGPTNGGNIDMRILLDTTGGTSNWTATWFAKDGAAASYTLVRPTATLLDEDITSIGLARSNTGVSGTITAFSLDAVAIPEPHSIVLSVIGCLGIVVLLRSRRTGRIG